MSGGRVWAVAVCLLLCAGQAQAAISVSIQLPSKDGDLVEATFPVSAVVTSTYQLANIVVTANGQVTPLAPAGSNTFTGMVTLSGVAAHTNVLLEFSATDVFGASAAAQRTVKYAPKPVLSVSLPTRWVVARPEVLVSASCPTCSTIDMDFWCQSGWTGKLATGTSVLNKLVTVPPAHYGNLCQVQFTGVDAVGQLTREPATVGHTAQTRYVVVEPSPYLTAVHSASSLLADASDTHLLTMDRSTSSIILHTRATASEQTILSGRTPYAAHLTPSGAIMQSTLPSGQRVLSEWRNGQLTDLATNLGPAARPLRVSGSYASWVTSSGLVFRRELVAGTTIQISSAVHTISDDYTADVAPNGNVCFTAYVKPNLVWHAFLYEQATSTLKQITSDQSYLHLGCVTDGINVGYLKYSAISPGPVTEIALATPAGELTLAKGLLNVAPHEHLQLNSGWTAFVRLDVAGVKQVIVRAPTGTETPVSVFNTNSSIHALNPLGQVIYSTNNQHYLPQPGKAPIAVAYSTYPVAWEVGSRAHWLSSQWHLTVGRTLFKVSTGSSPDGGVLSDAGAKDSQAKDAGVNKDLSSKDLPSTRDIAASDLPSTKDLSIAVDGRQDAAVGHDRGAPQPAGDSGCTVATHSPATTLLAVWALLALGILLVKPIRRHLGLSPSKGLRRLR